MSLVQASLQRVFLESLQAILKPIVRLTLFAGLGHSEFAAAVKRVFVEVASEDYGVRGRPANKARISAVTGLSRKSVSSYREQLNQSSWTPDDEASPLNTLIHYWRYDDRFCNSPGQPRGLELGGNLGFAGLVKSYCGDIPETTIKQTLLSEGIASFSRDGLLRLERDYSFPEEMDEDFLRNAAFAIGHHAETIVANAKLLGSAGSSPADHGDSRLFERIAWSRRLAPDDCDAFQAWVRDHGQDFILRADDFIARNEVLDSYESVSESSVSGVGIYFFRD